jgi:hypothetical protein
MPVVAADGSGVRARLARRGAAVRVMQASVSGATIRSLAMAALCAVGGGCATMPVATTGTVIATPSSPASIAPVADKRSRVWQADRLDRGYVVILPGSWGETAADHGIVDGLVDAGVDAAIEIYAWPVGEFPAGVFMVPYNLRATERNRGQARTVAEKIVRYQEAYPGRPVHIIGYSGGGGIAAWTLEELPEHSRITSAVLLAPTLSYTYDFAKALAHTDRGIDSFYSLYDVPVMMAGCSVVGTTDGSHRPAGGAVGFRQPKPVAGVMAAVRQHAYTLAMFDGGHAGGHYGWTREGFVAAHVAPLLGRTAATRAVGTPAAMQQAAMPAASTTR